MVQPLLLASNTTSDLKAHKESETTGKSALSGEEAVHKQQAFSQLMNAHIDENKAANGPSHSVASSAFSDVTNQSTDPDNSGTESEEQHTLLSSTQSQLNHSSTIVNDTPQTPLIENNLKAVEPETNGELQSIETELNTASLQTSDSHSLSGDRKMNNESDLNESEVDSTRLEEGEKDPSIVDDGAVQVKSENNNQLPNAQAAPFTFAAVNSQYSQAEATAFDDSSDDTDLTLSTNDQAGMPSQEFQLLSSIRDAQQVDTKVNTPLENANQATSSTGEVSDLATINSMSQEQLIVPVDSDTQDNMQSMSDSSITLATANGQTIPSQQAQVLTNIDDVQLTSNSTITLATDNGQTMPSQQAQLLSTGRDGQPVNSINTENGIDAVSDSFTTGTKSANQASSHNALQAQQVVSEGDNKVGLPLTQKTEQLTKNEQSNELSDSISEESVALVDQDSAPTALKMEGQATAQSIVDVNGAKPIQTSVIQSDKLVSMNQHMQATNNLLQEPLDIHSKQAAQIMGERVMMMLSEGKQEVQIRLDPAELGSMFIKVQVQQDQVQLHIQTQAGLSKDIIDQNMPRLREQLAQQGIQLSEANVEQQSQQHQQSGQQQSTQTMNSRNTHNTDVIDDNSTAIWMPSKIASNEQGIDYYA